MQNTYFDKVIEEALREEAKQAAEDERKAAWAQSEESEKRVQKHCNRLRRKPKKLKKYIRSTWGQNQQHFPEWAIISVLGTIFNGS